MVSTPQVQDKTLVRLVNFIYDQYPESRPLASPPLAPHCEFEAFYAVSDPQETSRPRFRLYPRVGEILNKTQERAAKLAKQSKALSTILPQKRRLFDVADEPEFATPLSLNPNFSRLTGNKTVSKKRMCSVSFFELERMEGCLKASLESNSHALWLISSLLSQVKQDGFAPSDPTLFNTTISSISCALTNQIEMAAAMSEFIVSKRRESYLNHVSLPISAFQKRELLITPGSGNYLFDQDLLEKVLGQVKEDANMSSIISLAKLAGSTFIGRGRSSSSSGLSGSLQGAGSSDYFSPIDYNRASPSSSSGKRSASPGCGGGGKRGRGCKGVSPSPKAKKGFRK